MAAKTDLLARENALILKHAKDVMAAAYLLEQKCLELDRRVDEALSLSSENLSSRLVGSPRLD